MMSSDKNSLKYSIGLFSSVGSNALSFTSVQPVNLKRPQLGSNLLGGIILCFNVTSVGLFERVAVEGKRTNNGDSRGD